MRHWSWPLLLVLVAAPSLSARAETLSDASPIELLQALERDPSLLKSVVLAAPGQGVPPLFPSYEKALATLTLSPEERQTVINSSLDVLLSVGLAADAVAFYRALPEVDKEALLARSPPARDERGHVISREGGPFLSLSLGAAFFLTGDLAAAHAILRRYPMEAAQELYMTLEAALHPERDPFEVLIEDECLDSLCSQVQLRLTSAYPGVRERLLDSFTTRWAQGFHAYLQYLPGSAADAMVPLLQKLDEQRAQWQAELDALREPLRKDLVTQGIARLIASPPPEPCTLAEQAPSPEWSTFRPKEPDGFRLLRAARRGQQAVALLHPAGHSRAMTIWLMTSNDAGKTWSTPAYLGLRSPYQYGVYSEGPVRLADGTLELSAERHDGAKSSKVLLSCDLVLVARDSDGDGLSDVEERWLLTDPLHPDTDRDGLTDDVDPIPHVPATGTPSLEGRGLLDALMSRDMIESSVLPRVGPPAGPARLVGVPRTVFVVASRAAFRGLSPSDRLIVLSPEEARMIGMTRALDSTRFPFLELFAAANLNETHVFVHSNGSYSDRTYMLRRETRGWRYELLSLGQQ